MKKLLLLIFLLQFSFNESKAQDSVTVTVTFRLNMLNPNGSASVVEDAIQLGIIFPFPVIVGNFADLGATAKLNDEYVDIPLDNFSLETLILESFFIGDTSNPNMIYLSIKFPITSVGQELKFSLGLTDFPITNLYMGDDIDVYSENSPHTACFTSSPEIDQLFALNNINGTGIVRTITIPPIDATYSYCWSSCLQCNGDAPGIINDENVLRTRTFVDLNNNSVLDAGEPPIQGINVQVNTSPNPINGFTGNNGRFYTYLPNGNYTVQIALPNLFSTSNTSQIITLADNARICFSH